MVKLRVCIIIARKHSETLDFEVSYGAVESGEKIDDVEEVHGEKLNLEDGLDEFQLYLRDEKGNGKLFGVEILDHMCRYRNSREARKADAGQVVQVEPTAGLHRVRITLWCHLERQLW